MHFNGVHHWAYQRHNRLHRLHGLIMSIEFIVMTGLHGLIMHCKGVHQRAYQTAGNNVLKGLRSMNSQAHNAFQQITALGLPDSSTQHVTRASRAHNACQQSSLQSTGLHGLIMHFDQICCLMLYIVTSLSSMTSSLQMHVIQAQRAQRAPRACQTIIEHACYTGSNRISTKFINIAHYVRHNFGYT